MQKFIIVVVKQINSISVVDQYTLTGKVGCRVINTSLSTPEKDGTSFGSGKRKLRASSSKLASISPAAKGNFKSK